VAGATGEVVSSSNVKTAMLNETEMEENGKVYE